ncbi:MAG: bifunctional diguanylate cyclase/phosphodiesterase [Chloroflexota bacterium]
MVMLGMLAMAGAIGVLMFATANALFVKQAHADLERQNQAVASEIENLTDRAAASLLIARRDSAFDRFYEADESAATERAAALAGIQRTILYLQRVFAIDEICVIRTSGTEDVRCVQGTLAGVDELSDDEAANPFFAPTMALEDGGVYRSTEPYLSQDTHRWVVAHSTPIILSSGRRAGLLHFEIPLDWFAVKVMDTGLSGAYSFLLDQDGHVLVHPQLDQSGEAAPSGTTSKADELHGFPHATAWGAADFRRMASEMLQAHAGTTSYTDAVDTYEVVFQPVFDGHWILATVMPHAVIYGPGAELLRYTLILVVPLLGLALALMIWYGTRLLAPLRTLATALRAVGAGRLQTVGITGYGEIGELGRAFDHMASELDSSLRKQVEVEAALQHQALHDVLTQLPNRAWLQKRLVEAIGAAEHDGRPWALLLLDLNRFKEINDTLGHDAGDQVLQEIARRLEAELRSCDAVARLGGDEFAILLGDTDAITAPRVVARLIELLEAPLPLDGHDVAVGASIGIALYPEHGRDVLTLMRRADAAMYLAKRSGGGSALSAPDQEPIATERLARLGALRQAISSEQLTLYYQPIVDCDSQDVVGVEALVRWQHPQYGLVPPDDFIPFAEQTGLIKPLTRWVLGTALRQCRAWQDGGLDLRVAVNLSAHDVQDLSLPGLISRHLADSGVEPSHLTVELTETALMADPERALNTLARLGDMGVEIAIDDFGTGYSSLSYLTRLPAHQLKIDRAFVSGLADETRQTAVVRSTIELGHTLGLKVVAEGVEDEVTCELLSDLGCDRVQGYHFARPMPARDIARWCTERRDLGGEHSLAA